MKYGETTGGKKQKIAILFSIENNSWDHLHTTLPEVKQQNNEKGDFTKITSLIDANMQINDASKYINSRIINK